MNHGPRPVLPLACCVILGKAPPLSESPISNLYTEGVEL